MGFGHHVPSIWTLVRSKNTNDLAPGQPTFDQSTNRLPIASQSRVPSYSRASGSTAVATEIMTRLRLAEGLGSMSVRNQHFFKDPRTAGRGAANG